ncbi:hypothetical protein E4U54_004389 [Claviceps lovelessii]|nr:hypothetical protein E4U54_004389 [Claviceps lovelessii]
MAFPPRHRDPFLELPSILSPRPGRCRRHHDIVLAGSPTVSIPKLESRGAAPPALPSPRHLPGLEIPVRREGLKKPYSHSASSSSSHLHISMHPSCNGDRSSRAKRRGTVSNIHGDEGYASYTAAERRSHNRRPIEFFQPCQLPFKSAADMHGDSMKKKLDTVCILDRSPRCMTLSAVMDHGHQRNTRVSTLNIPVQLPFHRRSAGDSPAGLSVDTPIFSAVSPGSAPFRHFPPQRIIREASDIDYPPRTRTRRNNNDDVSSSGYGNYEFTGTEDTEMDDAMSPKRLRSEEVCSVAGHKRRAASPPAGDHLCGASAEARRRDLNSRRSPTPRLHIMPQTSSTSSMSSAAISRSSSFISTMSAAPSTATTATSYGRRSSGANSPGGISPTCSNSPYTTPASVNHSPRNSISGRSTAHGRNISATSPRKMVEIQKPSGSKIQPVYMCECCPKKPKKFDTAEELR